MSDQTVEFEAPEESPFFPLTVKSIRRETKQAKSFVFASQTQHKAEFGYRPGQFLSFHIPLESNTIERSYSLSSSPGFDPDLMICVKRVANGLGSNWFNDHLQVGSKIWSKKPAGRFVLDQEDCDVLLIAGGSGITPCISLIKQALLDTKRKVKLIYANTSKPSVIYAQVLTNLVKQYPKRFSCNHWLDEDNGLIGPEDIVSLTRDCANTSCYICGPDQLMTMAENTLDVLPSVAASIRIERFVSSQNSTQENAHDETAIQSTEHFVSEYQLKLDDEIHQIPLTSGNTLLQAALDANLDVPHSCTEGHCGACMGQLIEGKVSMSSTKALSKRNLERGYVLLCQSRPSAAEPLFVDMDF